MILNKSDRFLVSATKLLGLFTAGFYTFFTLIPDSHSVVVLFPFVSLWQLGLLLPAIWLLILLWQGKVTSLGNGGDLLVGAIAGGVLISTLFAEFRGLAMWQGWVAFCYLAAIYALNSYLATVELRKDILIKYGYLSISFIVLSLFLWTTQTLSPELKRIESLKQQGVNVGFDFSNIELRNWAPIGHQNYVAGFLLLAIPVLVGLGVVERSKRRWLWLAGVLLGLVDLYSTSSKGGWLGLIIAIAVSCVCLLFFSSISRSKILVLALPTFAAIFFLIISNNRLYGFIKALSSGKTEGQLVYRQINAVLGWEMGLTHLFTGIGLGGVTPLYQQYRPFWAGRESELIYQLHSTPVQLWAEMGIWAIAIMLAAIAFLLSGTIKLLRHQNSLASSERILALSICASFLGYGTSSITDYQLDNVCISGSLVLLFVCLTRTLDTSKPSVTNNLLTAKPQKYLGFIGTGVTLVAISWLVVVHHAWQLSHQGFQALAKEDNPTFVSKLTQANALAPWEAYYPYQLAWNLGHTARETRDPHRRQELSAASIQWFRKAIAISPYREFGYSNLGWLLLQSNPTEATPVFNSAAKLVPAKRGIFLGLGFSLLAQQKNELAVTAFTLEALRDPLLITSPIWRSPGLKAIYPQLTQNLQAEYDRILEKHPDSGYFRLCRGSLHWWLGNMESAKKDWQPKSGTIKDILLTIDSETELKAKVTALSPQSTKGLLFASWFDLSQRSPSLQRAWLQQMKSQIPADTFKQIAVSMSQSDSFALWLRDRAPSIPYQRQRQGFGVVSRHIDGAIPADYFLVVENLAIATWFPELFPSPVYNVEVDKILQPKREDLLTKAT